MRMSNEISKLAPAFVKAQALVEGAKKDAANSHLKSKYADLSSVWEACKSALRLNDLAVAQFPVSDESGVGVETILVHSSGEWLAERFTLPFPVRKDGSTDVNAQAGGSCITYARRYALAALMGICPEDDDGHAATDASKVLKDKALAILEPAVKKGMNAYKAAWESLSMDMRKVIGGAMHERFKNQAEEREKTHAPAAV